MISATGQKIVIVKENDDSSNRLIRNMMGNDCLDVAWLTFDPMMGNNVSWNEEYEIYASATEMTGGATIKKSSYHAAMCGIRKYIFNTSGYFDEVSCTEDIKNAYYMENMYEKNQIMTFGLAQSANVNGKEKTLNPINAMPVAYNNRAHFIPIVRIKIFLAAQANDGKVISVSQSRTLTVDFTEQLERSVRYDQAAGAFVAND